MKKVIRHTTYSDPRMGRRSQGMLISLDSDERSFFGAREATNMEIVSRDETKTLSLGEPSTLNLGFVGSASGGFKFRLGIQQNGSFTTIFSSPVYTDYGDKTIAINIPELNDPSITMYQVVYIIESGDDSQTQRVDTVTGPGGSPFYLEINSAVPVGRSFTPSTLGTIIRTQSSGRVLYNSSTGVQLIGTTGVSILSNGETGYRDFYPYAIFNIPNGTSGNYVFAATITKGPNKELGIITNPPDLILLSPTNSAPVPYEEVYTDPSVGLNRLAPEWSFPGALDRGAQVIHPSGMDTLLGVVEYDIPDTIKGPCLFLLSNGLPYTSNPHTTGFSHRESERILTVSSARVYVKDGPAQSSAVSYREVNVDLSDVFEEVTSRVFGITANFGTASTTFGNLNSKVIPRIRSFSYLMDPNVATSLEIRVTNDFNSFVYSGNVSAGTSAVNVKVQKVNVGGGGGGGTPIPTTTVAPTTSIKYMGLVTSGYNYRQSQSVNPWDSQDILLSVGAYRNGNTRNPEVFNPNEFAITATGLPAGTTLTYTPLASSDNNVTYRLVIKNPSNTHVTAGDYPIMLQMYRLSGTTTASEEFVMDGFSLYVEPKLSATTTQPPPGDGDIFKVGQYQWAERPHKIFQIKGRLSDNTWSYEPVSGSSLLLGRDSQFIYGGVVAGFVRDSANNTSNTKWPFLIQGTALKDSGAYYYSESRFYLKRESLPTGSSFYATGSGGFVSNPWFIPNPDWVDYGIRTNERSNQNVTDITEPLYKYISGNMYNSSTGVTSYGARGQHLDFLIFPNDISQQGTMNLVDITLSIGGYDTYSAPPSNNTDVYTPPPEYS